MAKAKKKKASKGKVRDLTARKQVKGGLSKFGGRRTADPCEGGEIAGKMS